MFLITWAISIGAVIQRNHRNAGLFFLNWVLIVNMLYVLVLGTLIWVFTLHELDNFHKVYSEQAPATRIAFQDMVRCKISILPLTKFCQSLNVVVTLTTQIWSRLVALFVLIRRLLPRPDPSVGHQLHLQPMTP